MWKENIGTRRTSLLKIRGKKKVLKTNKWTIEFGTK